MGDRDVQCDERFPVDSVVADLMERAHNGGRGFALSLDRLAASPVATGAVVGAGGDAGDASAPAGMIPMAGRSVIQVVEQPPTPDEWEAPSKFRGHKVEDVGSFVRYAKKYGTPAKSLVFYDNSGAALVIDDQVERGEREVVRLSWVYAEDFGRWRAFVSQRRAVSHKDLLAFCVLHAHNFADIAALDKMRSIKASMNVKFDSDVRDQGNNYVMAFTTSKGDELLSFPKEISLSLPVLDGDVADEALRAAVKVRIEVIMPEKADQSVGFLLIAPDLDAAARARIDQAFKEVSESLSDWTVCRGSVSYAERKVGVPKR